MDTVLWGAGFVANSVLVFVLIRCGRRRVLPWFTTWIAYQVFATIALYLGLRWGSHDLYAGLYWTGALIDFLLQIALVIELAHLVLQTNGEWAEGARVRFYGIAVGGALFAGVMACWIAPSSASSLDVWELRGALFSTMLICSFFSGIMVVSQRLGLVWRGHVMRVGYGLIAWSFVAFATDTLHTYWGIKEHFALLEHTRQWTYVAAVAYWSVALWLPERVSHEISPAMADDLLQLQARAEHRSARGTIQSKKGLRP